MGLDIGIKLNKEISSDYLKEKFYSYKSDNMSDDIGNLNRGFCHLVLSKHYEDEEPLLEELSRTTNFDCKFIHEPKANYSEEDEETLFQFGWVNSEDYLSNLKKLRSVLSEKPNYWEEMNLSNDWKNHYFNPNCDWSFLQDIENLIEILEIANEQGVTEICYSVG